MYHQIVHKKILFSEDSAFYMGNFYNFFLSSREMNAISSL